MSIDIVASAGIRADAFSPFGEIIDRPGVFGERRMFSDWLGGSSLKPVFHTNAVPAARLPVTLETLERHPHAAQCFVPLDVSRFVVTVAESDAAGRPRLETLRAFILPGTRGVIYRQGVWHAPATVLDRAGSFAVLMWRGLPDDDEILCIASRRILAPEGHAERDVDLSQELA
jgi:ureidoglycolate lyase